jgi:hypothetical protein
MVVKTDLSIRTKDNHIVLSQGHCIIKSNMSIFDTPNWVWMRHPAHFIGAGDCQFFLATYVGTYIVSTVGERLSDLGDGKFKK